MTDDIAALCHVCGRALPAPSADRHPKCADCAASRPAARKRLAARCHQNRLRAYKVGASGQFSASDVVSLWRAQRGRCASCGRQIGPLYANPPGYHVDHRVSLAAGGANHKANLQLLCPPCNVRKGAS